MTEPIRVLIADDHTLVREGLRLLLDNQPDFCVVAEAADGATAVRLAAETCPDVVLLDVRMPELDGLQALAQIRQQSPEIKALILTMYDDEETFFQALRIGASGYLLKGSSSSELVDALRAVLRGEVYFSAPMLSLLVDDFLRGWRPPPCQEASPEEALSSRELEVLKGLAEGQTNAEIAAELSISTSTVQTHRTRILEKLGLRTRSDLVKYALRHRIICLD
jgi:DNA-binding NarL/FixJ family response regulator